MKDSAVRWENPPESVSGAGGRSWRALLDPLKKRPGKFANVRTMKAGSARTSVWRLRNRVYDVPEGEWEFEVRLNGDLGDIYACYIGPDRGGDAT